MSLNVNSTSTGKATIVTIVGEVDSSTAQIFMQEIEKAVSTTVNKLVIDMKDLAFMSSAGLRVLIFAKQRLGENVPIYLVKPQEPILDVLDKTGFSHSVNVIDEFIE